MSATASVANPAVAATAQVHGKAATAGANSAGGALGAFDAIMAAFFASMDGTAQTGEAAAATPALGQAVAADGDTADADTLTNPDGEAANSAATPDAALALALLGLGAPPPVVTPVVTTAVADGASASTSEPAAGSLPGPATPLPGPTDLAAADAGALAAPTPASDETPAAPTDAQAPQAGATGRQKADAAAPGERRATPTPPGLAHMAPSALEHARVAAAVETPVPAPDAPPAAPAAPAVETVAQVIQQATATAPAAKPADKTSETRPGKADEKAPRAARTEAVAPGAAGRVGGALANATPTAAGPAPDGKTPAVEGTPGDAPSNTLQAEAEAPPPETAPAGQASAQASLPTREIHAQAPAATPVRGSPETVASLSAHLIKKLDERASRFDLQLDPIGLGRVDVRLEISAHGQVRAAMSFDNPQAAAELKARSAELQQALEQAGFDITGGMSFDVADQSNGGARQQREFDSEPGAAFRGRAFQAALDTAGEVATAAAASALYYRQAPAAGVDVRI